MQYHKLFVVVILLPSLCLDTSWLEPKCSKHFLSDEIMSSTHVKQDQKIMWWVQPNLNKNQTNKFLNPQKSNQQMSIELGLN